MIASATVLTQKHPSMDRCKWTTSYMSITVGRAIREKFPTRRARAVTVVGTLTRTGYRDKISTDSAEAYIDTG